MWLIKFILKNIFFILLFLELLLVFNIYVGSVIFIIFIVLYNKVFDKYVTDIRFIIPFLLITFVMLIGFGVVPSLIITLLNFISLKIYKSKYNTKKEYNNYFNNVSNGNEPYKDLVVTSLDEHVSLLYFKKKISRYPSEEINTLKNVLSTFKNESHIVKKAMLSKKVKSDSYKFNIYSLVTIFKKYGYIFSADIAHYSINEDKDFLNNKLYFYNNFSHTPILVNSDLENLKLNEILDTAKENDRIEFSKDSKSLKMPIDFLYAILTNDVDYVINYIDIIQSIPNSYAELDAKQLYLFSKWIFNIDITNNTMNKSGKECLLFNKNGTELYLFDVVDIDNYKKKVNKESFINIKQLSNYENYTDKLGNKIEFKNF